MQDQIEHRPRRVSRGLLVTTSLAATGVIAALLVSSTGANARSEAVGKSALDPTSWARQAAATIDRAIAAHRTCSPQWDYPGCTLVQMRNLEAGTQAEFHDHKNLDRWHQGTWGTALENQHPQAYDKVRDAYNKVSGANWPYPMFVGFANNSDCFVPYQTAPTFWCWFDDNVVQKINQGAVTAASRCDRTVVEFFVGASVAAEAILLERVARGITGAAVGCLVGNAYDYIESWFSKAKGGIGDPRAVAFAL